MKNKRTTRKKKILSTLLAATVTCSVALAGTYAWRSVSQKALNEAKSSLNPGARLHDDFNGINLSSTQKADDEGTERKVKYVYVENFTDAQKQTDVYARIRLDEYLETGVGAGKPSNDATKSAQPLVAGTTIEDKTTWTPYKWDNDQTFRKYVTLSTGGDTVYMPTFNKDQDSLEADINGTLGGLDKNIETDTDDYSDYVKYTYDAAGTNTSTIADIEIYDAEGDGLDKVKEAGLDVETIVAAVKDPTTGKFNVTPNASSITIDGRSYTVTKMEPDTISTSADITAIYVDLDPTTTGATPQADIILKTAEHTAQMTLDTDPSLDAASTPGILSMADWNALPQSDKIGKYWVYDSEGWLYWAEPIEPSTATGCLLNGIAINDTTPDGKSLQSMEYYYGLNVVAQFATAGDWGDEADKTGFYKDGLTSEGEELLDTISAAENEEKAYRVELELQDEEQTVSPGSQVVLNVKVRKLKTGDEETDATKVSWSIDWAASQSVEEKSGRAVKVHPTSIDENGVLTIAENETAETLVIVATYNYDPSNVKKTVEGRITINVNGTLSYPITIEPTATTEATKGESIQFIATVNKQIADGTAEATTDGTTTWSVVDAETGNALSSKTAIDQNGKLTIDLAETAKVLKIIATYTVEYEDESGASQGNKQWTAEKTITLNDCSYTMATITAAGTAEPGKTIQYTTSVTRTNGTTAIGNAINSGKNSGIAWSLVGTPSDQDASTGTKIDPQTGILTIGANETNAILTVKASFKDPLNPTADGSVNVEKTAPVGKIQTTAYDVTIKRTDKTAVEQGQTLTFEATVKPKNGSDSVNAAVIVSPDIKWEVLNNTDKTGTTISGTKGSGKSTATLKISDTETATDLKVKATYQIAGADQKDAATTSLGKVTAYTYQMDAIKATGNISNAATSGTATPGGTVTFTAALKKTNSAGTTAADGSKIQWTLSGQTDTANTKLSATTGNSVSLKIGAAEKSGSITVTASYQDATNGISKSQTYTITGIETTAYTIEKTAQDYSAALVQGDDVTYTVKVKKANGTDAGNYVSDPAVKWSLSGNKTSTTKTDVTASGTEKKQKLTIGADETGTVKLTASYTGASDLVLHNATIAKQTYNVTLTGGSSTIVQEDTGNAYTVTVTKQNGKNAGARVALTYTSLTWNVVTPGKPDTTMTGHTYGTGTATAKLTVAATESASSVKVSASYIDANNGNAKTTSGESTVTIEASKYEIASFSVGATKLKPGESTAVTLTVNKTNGNGAPKQVANGANASGVTWSYSGNKLSGTQVTGGKLVIASGETGTSVTITPTYKAANGKTATTAGKTVTIDQLGIIQTIVANTNFGQTVTIGGYEWWVVLKDTDTSGKSVALLWMKDPIKNYCTKFGDSVIWNTSTVKNYLQGDFIDKNSTLKAMKDADIIKTVTNYTRQAYDSITQVISRDTIFLLSEADVFGTASNGNQTVQSWEYSTCGVLGESKAKQLNLTNSMKSFDNSTIVNVYDSYVWLRSPYCYTNCVARLSYDGVLDNLNDGDSYDSDSEYGIRPAFWMYL